MKLRGRERLDPYIHIIYNLNVERKRSHKHAHTCTYMPTQARTSMHTTPGPPNVKASGLEPKCNRSTEGTFWRSLDESHALEDAWWGTDWRQSGFLGQAGESIGRQGPQITITLELGLVPGKPHAMHDQHEERGEGLGNKNGEGEGL